MQNPLGLHTLSAPTNAEMIIAFPLFHLFFLTASARSLPPMRISGDLHYHECNTREIQRVRALRRLPLTAAGAGSISPLSG
jgi:hypothetical protein